MPESVADELRITVDELKRNLEIAQIYQVSPNNNDRKAIFNAQSYNF